MTTLSSFGYSYDPGGNKIRCIDNAGVRVTWVYDASNELIAERRSGSLPYNHTYTYDKAGNRTTLKGGTSPTTYTYNALNQIANSRDGSGITSFVFDRGGNLRSRRGPASSIVTMGWDGESRLISYETTTPTTFAYDADGHRVQRWDPTDGITRYVWDGETVLLENDGLGNLRATHTLRPFGFGEELYQRKDGVDHFYLYNDLGSTERLMTGSSTSDTYTYDAFGQVISSTGSTLNRLLFVGREGYMYEPNMALYYVRQRWYDASQGRFLTLDPIGGGEILPNFYLYCQSNPVNLIDPSGLDPIPAGHHWFLQNETSRNVLLKACGFDFTDMFTTTIEAGTYMSPHNMLHNLFKYNDEANTIYNENQNDCCGLVKGILGLIDEALSYLEGWVGLGQFDELPPFETKVYKKRKKPLPECFKNFKTGDDTTSILLDKLLPTVCGDREPSTGLPPFVFTPTIGRYRARTACGGTIRAGRGCEIPVDYNQRNQMLYWELEQEDIIYNPQRLPNIVISGGRPVRLGGGRGPRGGRMPVNVRGPIFVRPPVPIRAR